MYSIFAFGSSAALLWSCPAVPARQRWCAGRRGGSIFSVLQLSGTPLPAMIVSHSLHGRLEVFLRWSSRTP